MKTYFFVIVLVFFASITVQAQKTGDFIIATFEPSLKDYYARILSVKNDTVKANFVHSNSTYVYTVGELHKKSNKGRNDMYKGKVLSNVGGIYEKDTNIYTTVVSPTFAITAANTCENRAAILEYQDGKTFLASSKRIDDTTYEFIIRHSLKNYKVDVNTKLIKSSDGSYIAGGKLKSMYCTNYVAFPNLPTQP